MSSGEESRVLKNAEEVKRLKNWATITLLSNGKVFGRISGPTNPLVRTALSLAKSWSKHHHSTVIMVGDIENFRTGDRGEIRHEFENGEAIEC